MRIFQICVVETSFSRERQYLYFVGLLLVNESRRPGKIWACAVVAYLSVKTLSDEPRAESGVTPVDKRISTMREITIFSGTAHQKLAQEVCDCLAVALSPATIRHFSNDCLYVQLNANCRESDVFIIQPLIPPVQEHLVELLFMLDAAPGASAARPNAVIPFYSYARPGKNDAP